MKIEVTRARVAVTARFGRSGSILQDTLRTQCDGIETHLDVESPDSLEDVARLIRNAEAGCFIIQTLRQPLEVKTSASVNGEPAPTAS